MKKKLENVKLGTTEPSQVLKLKADFGNFPPSPKCEQCEERGEVKDDYVTSFWGSGYWTYKKCINCNGTGKNLWHCKTCEELMMPSFWCSNKNCKMFNIKVALGNKEA